MASDEYPPHLGQYIGQFESENGQVSATLFKQVYGVIAYVKENVSSPTDVWVSELVRIAEEHNSKLIFIHFVL